MNKPRTSNFPFSCSEENVHTGQKMFSLFLNFNTFLEFNTKTIRKHLTKLAPCMNWVKCSLRYKMYWTCVNPVEKTNIRSFNWQWFYLSIQKNPMFIIKGRILIYTGIPSPSAISAILSSVFPSPSLCLPKYWIQDFGSPKSWIQDFGMPKYWIQDFGLPNTWIRDFGIPKYWIQDFGLPKSWIQYFGIPKSWIQDFATLTLRYNWMKITLTVAVPSKELE